MAVLQGMKKVFVRAVATFFTLIWTTYTSEKYTNAELLFWVVHVSGGLVIVLMVFGLSVWIFRRCRYDSATAKGDHTARPKTSPALYHQYPVPTAPALQQPDEPVAIWSSGSDANGDYVRLQRGGAPMGASFEASDNYDHMPMGPNDDVYSTLQREERKRQVVDNIYNSCTISSEG